MLIPAKYFADCSLASMETTLSFAEYANGL